MPINIGTSHIQPHRCTWVVLWLFCFRSTPQRSLIHGPLSKVLFGESLVNRVYSEIDQTYLSIEAQCVSHYYPRWTATVIKATSDNHGCQKLSKWGLWQPLPFYWPESQSCPCDNFDNYDNRKVVIMTIYWRLDNVGWQPWSSLWWPLKTINTWAAYLWNQVHTSKSNHIGLWICNMTASLFCENITLALGPIIIYGHGGRVIMTCRRYICGTLF